MSSFRHGYFLISIFIISISWSVAIHAMESSRNLKWMDLLYKRTDRGSIKGLYLEYRVVNSAIGNTPDGRTLMGSDLVVSDAMSLKDLWRVQVGTYFQDSPAIVNPGDCTRLAISKDDIHLILFCKANSSDNLVVKTYYASDGTFISSGDLPIQSIGNFGSFWDGADVIGGITNQGSLVGFGYTKGSHAKSLVFSYNIYKGALNWTTIGPFNVEHLDVFNKRALLQSRPTWSTHAQWIVDVDTGTLSQARDGGPSFLRELLFVDDVIIAQEYWGSPQYSYDLIAIGPTNEELWEKEAFCPTEVKNVLIVDRILVGICINGASFRIEALSIGDGLSLWNHRFKDTTGGTSASYSLDSLKLVNEEVWAEILDLSQQKRILFQFNFLDGKLIQTRVL